MRSVKPFFFGGKKNLPIRGLMKLISSTFRPSGLVIPSEFNVYLWLCCPRNRENMETLFALLAAQTKNWQFSDKRKWSIYVLHIWDVLNPFWCAHIFLSGVLSALWALHQKKLPICNKIHFRLFLELSIKRHQSFGWIILRSSQRSD